MALTPSLKSTILTFQENEITEVSVAEDEPFRRRFVEMARFSLSIAALSFGVGYLIRQPFGVDV